VPSRNEASTRLQQARRTTTLHRKRPPQLTPLFLSPRNLCMLHVDPSDGQEKAHASSSRRHEKGTSPSPSATPLPGHDSRATGEVVSVNQPVPAKAKPPQILLAATESASTPSVRPSVRPSTPRRAAFLCVAGSLAPPHLSTSAITRPHPHPRIRFLLWVAGCLCFQPKPPSRLPSLCHPGKRAPGGTAPPALHSHPTARREETARDPQPPRSPRAIPRTPPPDALQ
jgi:hypothetical protein